MWGERPLSATEEPSGVLPGLQTPHFPAALVNAASLATHPIFAAAVPDIARQEILAGEAIDIISRSDRGDRAAGAGFGIFPRLARPLPSAAKHFGSSSARKGQVAIIRLGGSLVGD